METLLIEIDGSKHDFFVNLLKEFSFIKTIKTIDEENSVELLAAIEESENDILKGDLKSHEELKNEILTWRK